MVDTAGILAQIMEPGGDPLRLDINDGVVYLLDPRTRLGSPARRRTTLEAPNVSGATVAARALGTGTTVLVVNILPQEETGDLLAAYAALKEALATPSTLAWAYAGQDPGDPFFIDLDAYDDFPEPGDVFPWLPGTRPQFHADIVTIPIMRHPGSYGFGTYL